MSHAQANRPHVSDQTKQKMSLSSKGKPKSQTHSQNISKGRKEYLQTPAGIQQRRAASSLANSRPEVRAKISQALKGRPKSDETRSKLKIAANTRVQNEDYINKQRVSQSARWQNNPAVWWNNGNKNVRSVTQPAPDYVPGRISFGTWWTNGTVSVMKTACPGPGWIPGRRVKSTQTKLSTN
jgi:hypothetical protein